MNDAMNKAAELDTNDDAPELDSDEIVDTDASYARWVAWQARGAK
jgi:hypothetical protein